MTVADDYTPTTEEVREWWAEDQDRTHGMGDEAHMAEFDRWLEQHTAEKRAEWEAEQGEVEWEYGYRPTYAPMHPDKAGQRMDQVLPTPRTPENWLPRMREIYRRTKAIPAGEWVLVNENGSGQ